MFKQLRSELSSLFASQFARKVALVACVVLLLFENMLLIGNYLRQGMPIMGLKLYDQPISGLSRSAIAQLAREKFSQSARPLILTAAGQTFRLTPHDVRAHVDINRIADQLISLGRNEGFFYNTIQQNKAFFGLSNWRVAQGTVSQAMISLKILELQDAINQSAAPAMPDFAGDLTTTLGAQDGIQIDSRKLGVLIAQNVLHPPVKPLAIPLQTIKAPTYDNQAIAAVRNDALKILREKKPVIIQSAGQIFSLDSNDLKQMFTVVERPDPKNPKIKRLRLRLDDKKLNRKLGQFATQVEQVTGAEFDDHDARVAIYAQVFGGTRKTFDIPTGNKQVLFSQTQNKVDALDTFVQVLPNPNQGKVAIGGEKTAKTNAQQMAGLGYDLAEIHEPDSPPQDSNAKVAYLTFDDGPNGVYHPLVLDILKNYNVKATFFLVGNNTIKYTDIAKRTVVEGHEIGNHSLTHAFLPKLPQEEITKEVQMTETILKPINNDQDVTLFRPPYGGVNDHVKSIAQDQRLKLTLWNVDPRDWSEPAVDDLVNRVVSHTRNGSDILLHSNHLATVKALPKIIDSLQTQGYRFELLP